MSNLDKEYQYFEDNRAALLKQYRGKLIVIKGKGVIGAYDSETEAYEDTVKKHKLGTFLIQLCLPDKEIPPQVFHSRVIF
ncbi:MAG: hypothetical protein Q8R11_03195 [bacterium]|nr:hypothetical protein [bacterium]